MGDVFLGIDGGGSKTAAVVLDADGRILAEARAGGSAIVGEPSPESCAVLAAVAEQVCAQAGVARESVTHCGVGLNGIDFEDEFAVQLEGVCGCIGIPPERLTLVNDGIVALWGATPVEAAGIVQHGSGFTGASRSTYGREILFGHLGTGTSFDIRRQLTVVVARMIDGRVEPTPLKEAALEHFGVDESTYDGELYRGRIPQDRLKTTPPLVFKAWVEGDPAAARLVIGAVEDYALAAKVIVARTGSETADMVFGGGVILQAPEQFWDLIAERTAAYCPKANVHPPLLQPEYGAAVMAAFHCGVAPEAYFGTVMAECENRHG